MSNILDSVSEQTRNIRPETVSEYQVLQLARRLGDIQSYWRYRSLFDHYPPEVILKALAKATSKSKIGPQRVAAFHEQLTELIKKEEDDEL